MKFTFLFYLFVFSLRYFTRPDGADIWYVLFDSPMPTYYTQDKPEVITIDIESPKE